MKSISTKMLISVFGAIIAIPFFAIAIVVGAHAISLAQNSTNSVLLLCISCFAVAISVVNGIGRNRASAVTGSHSRSALNDSGSVRRTAGIHLGF